MLFDAEMWDTLKSITHSSISDTAWKQFTVSVRLGGLSLRESTGTASAAFLASCNATRLLSIQLLALIHKPIVTSPLQVSNNLCLEGKVNRKPTYITFFLVLCLIFAWLLNTSFNHF